MNKLQYTFKTDTLFKMLFVKHEDLLKKLPNDIKGDYPLLLWLSLFKAETEEELEKIRGLEVPEMEQAINAYYAITASSEFREKERFAKRLGMTKLRLCIMQNLRVSSKVSSRAPLNGTSRLPETF